MADIYSKASQVLACLGSPDSQTVYTTKVVISYLNGSIQYCPEPGFLRHPYFERVWILQEISLVKSVLLHVGRKTVHWTASTVERLLQLCKFMGIEPSGALRWVPANRLEENDLLDVLHRVRNCFSKDPKNKVFALHDLYPKRVQGAILFNNVAVYPITSKRSLEMLEHVPPWQNFDLDKIPSWVRNWSTHSHTSILPAQLTLAQMDVPLKLPSSQQTRSPH
jgi:hypothetical protein